MEILKIIEVGNPRSVVRFKGEMCDRILNNDTIIDIYEKQKEKKSYCKGLADFLYENKPRKRKEKVVSSKNKLTILEIIKYEIEW